ncbi:hypothetical protein EDB85DRAFT_237746 [Lactarius pseudohatsudake]|nr:hypothetical protein EDB85DRAFT_312500 [Lactarius pseudohatsudake]KAH9025213.1 hypothetical protein EDB85DRAFT_237746 [Lactarius pseudohatsudake]
MSGARAENRDACWETALPEEGQVRPSHFRRVVHVVNVQPRDRPTEHQPLYSVTPRCGISSVLVIGCFAGISEPPQSQRTDGEWSTVVSNPVVRRRELTSLWLTVRACVRSTAYCKKVLALPRDRRRSRLKSHWTWISISCMTYCVRIHVSVRFLSGSARGLCRLERLQCKHLSYFWEGWADTRNMGVMLNENWRREDCHRAKHLAEPG